MIKVRSKDDIKKIFAKNLGSGEESTVGLLKDGKHVAKIFHQPRSLNEKYNLLIGSELKQDSFCFLKDLYANEKFIFGGISDYASGNTLDKNIVNVSFLDLLYSTLPLKKDIKTISDEGILVGDWKLFNTVYTDSYIKIIDTGRFIYSHKNKEEIYRYNLEMIFGMIRMVYNNDALKQILEHERKLDVSFRNNEKFPEFFVDLEKYLNQNLGESVKSLGEYMNLTKK